jgi:hypothetical protein
VTENEDPVLQLNVQERRLQDVMSTSHPDEPLHYNKANFPLEDTKELYLRGHSLKVEVITCSFLFTCTKYMKIADRCKTLVNWW